MHLQSYHTVRFLDVVMLSHLRRMSSMEQYRHDRNILGRPRLVLVLDMFRGLAYMHKFRVKLLHEPA